MTHIMFSTSSSWTYFGTGTYLPPPVTTAIFPARASGRKGEDGEGVDAAMVLATAPTVRRVLMVRAREMLRAENTREAESWWIVSTYKPVSYIHEIRSAYDVCVSHILSTHRGIRERHERPVGTIRTILW